MKDSTAISPPQSPHCAGCGCDLEAGVRFCVVCADRQQSRPVPMFNTAPQPAPPEPKGEALGGFAGR